MRMATNTDRLSLMRTFVRIVEAVVSEWIVTEDIAAGRLVHLAPRWHAQPLPVYVVHPQARFYPAKLRKLIEIMRTAFDARGRGAARRGAAASSAAVQASRSPVA